MKKPLISLILLLTITNSLVHAGTFTSTISSMGVSTSSNSFWINTTDSHTVSTAECTKTNSFRYEFGENDIAGQALYSLFLTAKTTNSKVGIAFSDTECYGNTNAAVIGYATIQ